MSTEGREIDWAVHRGDEVLHRPLSVEILRIQLCADHLIVLQRLFMYFSLLSTGAALEQKVTFCKQCLPYARDVETFSLSLKLSCTVLISVYCCEPTSRKCGIGLS